MFAVSRGLCALVCLCFPRARRTSGQSDRRTDSDALQRILLGKETVWMGRDALDSFTPEGSAAVVPLPTPSLSYLHPSHPSLSRPSCPLSKPLRALKMVRQEKKFWTVQAISGSKEHRPRGNKTHLKKNCTT
ncbi:hypothetical protein E2C01_053578 [Portunus trituberculatus]|uniref:Secreted protein n=1 Tax=Portunus trituberculatus TaxID=210409 RepID=A0A5B7GQH1_PORTR|nr:hypothetical protein [Portunus trituberculatus]